MAKKEKKSKYDTFCSVCGFPLMKHQIAAVLDDCTVMDYEERQYVTFSAHFCEECWNKVKNNNIGGMERAMESMKNLKRLDKEFMKVRR